MPWVHYLRVRELLPRVELVDATAEYASLRRLKSAEEIERLRGTAQLMGIQLGALTVVTDDGAESLHTIPLEPLLAG